MTNSEKEIQMMETVREIAEKLNDQISDQQEDTIKRTEIEKLRGIALYNMAVNYLMLMRLESEEFNQTS